MIVCFVPRYEWKDYKVLEYNDFASNWKVNRLYLMFKCFFSVLGYQVVGNLFNSFCHDYLSLIRNHDNFYVGRRILERKN